MSWRQLLRSVRDGLEHSKPDLDPRQRLQIAGRAFWRAMFHLERWPPSCQDEAKAITGTLLADGLIQQTINAMDAEKIVAVSDRLRAFCKRMAELPFQPGEEAERSTRMVQRRELQRTP